MYDEFAKKAREEKKGVSGKKFPLWGNAIKALLHEKIGNNEALSIPELARKSGLNEKSLYHIIAGRIRDPSSDKLIKIAEALGISFPELAAKALAECAAAYHITGFNEKCVIRFEQHGFSLEALTPPGAGCRDFFVGIMRINPFQDLKKWKFKDNSMICIVLEAGTLEVTIGNSVKQLHANQTIYFDGGIPHKFRNIDSIPARLFLVTRPPLY